MPHPEAYNHPTNHPDWTLRRETEPAGESGPTPGIRLFINAVKYFG